MFGPSEPVNRRQFIEDPASEDCFGLCGVANCCSSEMSFIMKPHTQEKQYCVGSILSNILLFESLHLVSKNSSKVHMIKLERKASVHKFHMHFVREKPKVVWFLS